MKRYVHIIDRYAETHMSVFGTKVELQILTGLNIWGDPHFLVYKFGCQGDKKLGPLTLRTPRCVFENGSQTASKNKTEGSTVFYLYPTHSVTQWGTVTVVEELLWTMLRVSTSTQSTTFAVTPIMILKSKRNLESTAWSDNNYWCLLLEILILSMHNISGTSILNW